MNNSRQYTKRFLYLLLLAIIVVNTLFRIFSLGYSNFQGDEVSAQNYLFGELSFTQFLVTRTVGPMQYLVTYPINALFFEKLENMEFAVRLPFAISGVLVVVAVFLLCRKFFSVKAGVFTSYFVALSGLLIAFSRIVQYQTFVILISVISFYFFFKYLDTKDNKMLVVSGVFSALGFLFHYDALSFILPIVLILLFETKELKENAKKLVYFAGPIILLCSLFYIPFIFNPIFRSTIDYLFGRRIISGFKYDSIYYSLKIFTIYHSKEFLILLLLSGLLAVASVLRRLNKKYTVAASILVFLVVLRAFSVNPNPILILSTTILGIALLFALLYKNINSVKKTDVILVWFLFTFTAYLLFFTKPLTHIYTIFVPMSILLGLYLEKIENRTGNTVLYLILIVVGVASLSFNYQAFIDSSPEYPRSKKNYVFGSMYTGMSEGEEVKGIFGFPHSRDWKKIRDNALEFNISSYKSNEKYRLTKYYMRGFEWDDFNFDVYIWVEGPQSLSKDPKPTLTPVFEESTYAIFVLDQVVNGNNRKTN